MSKRVLIVDDQPGIRILLEEVIREEGHEVISVCTGAKALDQIKKQQPDLLLIDYKLPVLDGPAVLDELKDQGLSIPTIMMSGLAEEAGAFRQDYDFLIDVLAKPFDILNVRKMVNQVLKEGSNQV
ncbi:response regulator [Terribacillus sp. 7520-G]|uniref:response regulator n=1 Tax=Terribacillus TaxID=459532 RepID=UPI00130473E1|nr:response regulator [Terribacillus sp. 7520-G]